MNARALLVCLLTASCYNPELLAGHFVCDNNADCPTHLICAQHRCVAPAGTDLANTAAADMAAPMGSTDMASDPCKDGWVALAGQEVFACRRSFSVSGSWTGLCRASHHVCDNRDAQLLTSSAAAITAACGAAGRFFTARLDVGISNSSSNPRQADGNCSSGSQHALLGCGSDSGLYKLRNTTCSGLNQVMDCSNELSGWSCSSSNGVSSQVSYNSNQGGLLCCRD